MERRQDMTLERLAETLERQVGEDRLHEGDTWYLVSSRWWIRVFGTYSSNNFDRNDVQRHDKSFLEIQNACLLDLDRSDKKHQITVLQPMLMEGQDYRLVSQRVWKQLVDSFGYDWEIPRLVITQRLSNTLLVEVHPITFEIFGWRSGLSEPCELFDDEKKPLILTASQSCSLKELQLKIWQIASKSQLSTMFADIQEESVSTALQVCYRVDEQSLWKSFKDVRVQTDQTFTGFQLAQNPELILESIRVEHLELNQQELKSGNVRVHQLLVEGRFESKENSRDWRHNRFYSQILAEAWRFTLESGQLIDAMDTDNKWYESRIVDLKANHVKVHYRGWTSKWDEWIDRLSSRLAPLHTKVQNWRDFQIDDKILVGSEVKEKPFPEWRIARVIDVEKELTNSLRIQLEVDGMKVWMDAQDEMLCPVGTHKAVNSSKFMTSNVQSHSLVSSYSRYGRDEIGRGRPAVAGVVGLVNLGNTCFMNSMLQCLINTAPLREYFLRKDPTSGHPFFTKEINRDNPLGMSGMMAVEFASLLRKMWSNEFRVVTPTKLKSVIGQYAPQFAGYQQQDSQELMNFLLDGLHEDLNRVKSKPYTEPVERNGRTDSEVAREEWHQFLRRNDSVIVENFMGQLRSHVTCSNANCGNESITFDPYMNLSVPIPSNETVRVQVQLFWANGDIPTQYALCLPKEGCSILTAKEKLSELSKVPMERIYFVEVWRHRIVRPYADKMSIERVRDHILHAYELEKPVTKYSFSSSTIRPHTEAQRLETLELQDETKKEFELVELLHQAPVASPVDGRTIDERYDTFEDNNYKQRRVEVKWFNLPLLVSIQRKSTKAQVHDKVWQVVHRLVATEASDLSENQVGCKKDQQVPYRLHVTEASDRMTYMSDLSSDSEPWNVFRKRPFSLTLEWNRYGYQRGYDETSAKRIEPHESMKHLTISTETDPLTLFDCLSKFTEREQLGEADTWYCPKCKTHVRAFKKFDLYSLPKVLIFHLKRFRYAQNSFYMHRDKISSLVDFPTESLDLSAFVIGPGKDSKPLYDLYAVSEHVGGLGGGHYTAVAKNPETKQCVCFVLYPSRLNVHSFHDSELSIVVGQGNQQDLGLLTGLSNKRLE
ncbi:putative peptidase C19, ubiquitin-specific peptidase, DUSP domain, Chromo-like domain superfamily [Plasmopara halstedii]